VNKIVRSLVIVFIISFYVSTFLVPHAEAVENSWTTMADMPTSRLGPGVAVVNGKIYVIGGTGGGGYLNTNEEYDPATNTWVTKKPMPTPRAGFAIAVYKNKIYCIGGGPGNDWTVGFEEVTRMNEVYDPLTDTWETKTPMPTAREFLCANVVNGKIYLIGGSKPLNLNDPSFVPNINEVYDPVSDSWTTKTPPPVKVSSYASAVVDDKIYIIGGSPVGNLTQIYHPETNTWSYGASVPNAFWGAAAGAITGVLAPKRIYVIGGYPTFTLNQVYDPEKNVWTMGAQMPTGRYGLGVAVVDDILYAIGGAGKKNEQYTPFGFETVPPPIDQPGPPVVSIFSPENKTYTTSNIPLTFTLSKTASWIGYSLNGQANVTITENTTLTGLSDGSHSLRVYANDTAGNMSSSETINFAIAKEPEHFPTTLVAAALGASVAIIGFGLLLYVKKRKH
jgi:N-acetylneuraminic acid mutarotase